MSNSPGSAEAYSKESPLTFGSNASASPSPAVQDWSYEVTVKKVEIIMDRIESGELELAEVFAQFTTAVEYLQQCEAFLASHQKQVDLLIETLADESDS